MAGRRGKGEGSIFRRKDGSWTAMITIGRNPDGSSKRMSFYGKTRKEVAEKMQPVLNSIQTGSFVEPSRITMNEWLDTWLNTYKKNSLKPTTYDSYEQNIRVHIRPALGHIMLKDLRVDHVQKFINDAYGEGKLSTWLMRKLKNILHGSLKQAVVNQLIMRNVSEGIILPKHKQKEIRVFTKVEEKLFIQTLENDRLTTAFKLDLVSGLRLGELLGLTWDNIDLDDGIIQVKQSLACVYDRRPDAMTKTKLLLQDTTKTACGRRKVPIPKSAVEMLKEHKWVQGMEKQIAEGIYEDNNFVFCTSIGTAITPRNAERSFVRLAKMAGITGANVHSLRHTYATRLFEKGVPAKTVSELLGHANVAHTLNVYTHVLPDTKSKAVQKLDYMLKDFVSSYSNLYSNQDEIKCD